MVEDTFAEVLTPTPDQRLESTLSKLCIYHAGCPDGFSAAWVLYRKFIEIEFFPAVHGEPPPNVTDREVYMVDFSYPRAVLLDMAKQATSITILDHHKTAQEALVDLPGNVVTVFDMEKSGSVLAWQFFYPNYAVPSLLLHVQDQDLWRFSLPNTREIMAAVSSHAHDFITWDMLVHTPTEDLITEGASIRRYHYKCVLDVLGESTSSMEIGGYTVPVVNAPVFLASDACAVLAQTAPFSAAYWDTATHRNFSLRSSPTGLDVSEIAAQYGGGGHKHASGFRVPISEAKPGGPYL